MLDAAKDNNEAGLVLGREGTGIGKIRLLFESSGNPELHVLRNFQMYITIKVHNSNTNACNSNVDK
jgi:hypothetical protein